MVIIYGSYKGQMEFIYGTLCDVMYEYYSYTFGYRKTLWLLQRAKRKMTDDKHCDGYDTFQDTCCGTTNHFQHVEQTDSVDEIHYD